jgi:hypothetical protein
MLRSDEFRRLDVEDVAYLDYAGAALYADSQIAAHRARLGSTVLGNPHSEHGASLASTRIIDRVRQRVCCASSTPATTMSSVSRRTRQPRSSSSASRIHSVQARRACCRPTTTTR